jgi:uncharacterized protein HemY
MRRIENSTPGTALVDGVLCVILGLVAILVAVFVFVMELLNLVKLLITLLNVGTTIARDWIQKIFKRYVTNATIESRLKNANGVYDRVKKKISNWFH